MRFEHDGIMFWFGTSDAPAPRGHMAPGLTPSVTIGVRPMSGGNQVEVMFRTQSGRTGTVTADWLWSDQRNRVQYFRARLPAIAAGERVDFRAICHCSGGQAPAAGTEHLFPGSFLVGDTENTQGEHHGS